MDAPADFYDGEYGRSDDACHRAIRSETFDVDLGQESWLQAAECERFGDWLQLAPGRRLLEVACGAGGVARHLAARTGADVVGIDVNRHAIAAAQRRAAAAGRTAPAGAARVEFRIADATAPLPFADASFDAVFCNDAINHFVDRPATLREWHRVLRPGGRCLFTDPVVVTGLVTNAELAVRSSIGFFVFSAPGANEALLRDAGFRVERTVDATDGVVVTSRRWHDARERRRELLVPIEGQAKFDDVQRFLAAVHTLATERRLCRRALLAVRDDAV
jgi:SAM-dependent methyltransferase